MLSIADVLIEFPRPGGQPWLAESSQDQAEAAAEQLEAAVAAARDEALSEAQATAAEELEAARVEALVEREAAIVEARAAWSAGEGTQLAAALATGLATLETTLADALAAVMRPVIDGVLADRVRDEVLGAVRALLAGSQGGLVTLRGPADLLAGVRTAFADNAAVVLVDDATPDVTIEAGDTAMATRLESWRTRLDAALETSR